MLNAFLLCNVQNYLCILNKKHISHSHILGQTQMVLVSYKGISCMSELSTRLWIAIILLLCTDSSHEEQTVYPPPRWFFHLAHFIKMFMSVFKLLIFLYNFSWEVQTRSIWAIHKNTWLFWLALMLTKCWWKNLDFSGFIYSLFSCCWQITYTF